MPVLPVYILDDMNAEDWKMDGASRAWLHNSLASLSSDVKNKLLVLKGDGLNVLKEIIRDTGAKQIFWNRCYEPWRIHRDKNIKDYLNKHDIECHSFNGSLLWEPWDIKKNDGTPYRVFTPFYRNGCLNAPPPREPLPTPVNYILYENKLPSNVTDADFLPLKLSWHKDMLGFWDIGESAAQKRLVDFLRDGLKGYKEGRNYPAQDSVSRLSPYLHFGEISPNQVWYAAQKAAVPQCAENDVDAFCAELGWREFSNSLLYYNSRLPEEPLNTRFNEFEWAQPKKEFLERWQKGETGFPLVDAGMRELWATGYMHNRVRMVVASFLVKNLRYHWRHGENWFWDTLVDADLANNAASWQWIAGCGADAAPYFRIFNPVTQGKKFDPDGEYINRWAPDSHGIKPILDVKASRDAALEAFRSMQ